MNGATDLSITAGGDITDSGAIVTGSGTTTIQTTDGSLTLNTPNNDFTGVVIADSTGDIVLRDINTIETGSIGANDAANTISILANDFIIGPEFGGAAGNDNASLDSNNPFEIGTASGDPNVAVVSDVELSNMSLTNLFFNAVASTAELGLITANNTSGITGLTTVNASR